MYVVEIMFKKKTSVETIDIKPKQEWLDETNAKNNKTDAENEESLPKKNKTKEEAKNEGNVTKTNGPPKKMTRNNSQKSALRKVKINSRRSLIK